MNPIQNVGASNPVSPVTPKVTAKPASEESAASPVRGRDRLELSGTSHLLKALQKGTDMRADKVAGIKAQIEAGTYEDDLKLDAATDKMLDDLLK